MEECVVTNEGVTKGLNPSKVLGPDGLHPRVQIKRNGNIVRSCIFQPFLAVNQLSESLRYEPLCEKTGLRGFRPGPTQTGLCSDRRLLEA